MTDNQFKELCKTIYWLVFWAMLLAAICYVLTISDGTK